MRFRRTGNSSGPQTLDPLTAVRIDEPDGAHCLGRRDADFGYERLFFPSLVIDQTELMLRRAGASGEEGFGLWAGTLAGGDGFVSTLLVPSITEHGIHHGEIAPETVARLLDRLDHLDLVPLCQIHSHPRLAYLSEVDAERPLIAVPGFLSAIVPNFGFVDVADTENWRTFEYRESGVWKELSASERQQRIVIDPSLMWVE